MQTLVWLRMIKPIKTKQSITLHAQAVCTLRANTVVYGPCERCEQESEEKNAKFCFFNMQNRTFVKKNC